TWGGPVVLDSTCGFDAFVQGSQVVVGNAGEVFVAWERSNSTAIREMLFARSPDGGVTFSAPVVVSDVTCAGDCFHLQGGFGSGLEYPSVTLDSSNTPTRGNLYVAWADGRNLQVSDEAAPMGFYGYADIFLKSSTDGGNTWSDIITVNKDRPKHNTDQYQPA